jgi:hypothetical protein
MARRSIAAPLVTARAPRRRRIPHAATAANRYQLAPLPDDDSPPGAAEHPPELPGDVESLVGGAVQVPVASHTFGAAQSSGDVQVTLQLFLVVSLSNGVQSVVAPPVDVIVCAPSHVPVAAHLPDTHA